MAAAGSTSQAEVNAQQPLPRAVAARAVARCALGDRGACWPAARTHLPRARVGQRLFFADQTSARVFRETVVDGEPPDDPCLLVVEFRLRLLRGRWHRLFLWECILNTPLFVGFPGFVSKLWLDRDEQERYRGSLRVGRCGRRGVLRPLAVAGARAGVPAGVDPLPGDPRPPA